MKFASNPHKVFALVRHIFRPRQTAGAAPDQPRTVVYDVATVRQRRDLDGFPPRHPLHCGPCVRRREQSHFSGELIDCEYHLLCD